MMERLVVDKTSLAPPLEEETFGLGDSGRTIMARSDLFFDLRNSPSRGFQARDHFIVMAFAAT